MEEDKYASNIAFLKVQIIGNYPYFGYVNSLVDDISFDGGYISESMIMQRISDKHVMYAFYFEEDFIKANEIIDIHKGWPPSYTVTKDKIDYMAAVYDIVGRKP
jgi:hypothetical protein